MADNVIVLGAGIVGLSIACQLASRGREVLLLDRQLDFRSTSYGNAGLIQTECVRPYSFPRDLAALWKIAGNRSPQACYDLWALPGYASPLLRYWWHSEPSRFLKIMADYATLIGLAAECHAEMSEAASCRHLIQKQGWIKFYHSEAAFQAGSAEATEREENFGIRHEKLDGRALQALEPAFSAGIAGAIHWIDAWSVTDTGALLHAYADHFRALGGRITLGDAMALRRKERGWEVTGEDGAIFAPEVVVALGPWSGSLVRRLGYRVPLFTKRGYHAHFAVEAGAMPSHPLSDVENGYVLAPMRDSIRLTAGVEFARPDAPPNLSILAKAEAAARRVYPLGQRLDATPWMGARPCMPDMKPVIGRASGHAGLWLAFGHGHQGLTLGPATGKLMAAMMCGEPPPINPAPFDPARLG